MTAAFTSDVKTRWSAEWIAWPDFATFWAQTIRNCMQSNESRGGTVQLTREDGRLHLTLDTVDENQRFLSQGEGELTVIGPAGLKKNMSLEAVAPGRYEALIEADKQGTYYMQTTFRNGEKIIAPQARGYTIGYSDKLRLRETNTQLLEQLAEQTGGIYNPTPDSLFAANDGRIAWKAVPLWPWLLTAALCFYAFDVLLRRVELVGMKK